MGCDIHLYLEKRLKAPTKVILDTAKYNDKGEEIKKEISYMNYDISWHKCHVIDNWSDRVYGMFAKLSDVRNYNNIQTIPIRGFPEDASDSVKSQYGFAVTDKDTEVYNWEAHISNAEKWVKEGCSNYYDLNGRQYVSHPDYHSPNWCSTTEMEQCIDSVFKDENGNLRGDYMEWLVLLNIMKAYESTGQYECRAVFWFDN